MGRALLLALKRVPLQPRVFNVCTGRSTSIDDLALAIADPLGCEPRIERLPRRDGEIRYSLGDPSAARQTLGFEARTFLKQGLALTIRSAPPDRAKGPAGGALTAEPMPAALHQ